MSAPLAEITADIMTAARAIRGSSWPGDMAEAMEQRANRLETFARGMLDLPIGVAQWVENESGMWCAIGDGGGFAAEGLPEGSLIYAYPTGGPS